MRTAVAATAIGITLSIAALASCSSDPGEMPVPSPSVTPVFASEEEALAAAEKLYGDYVAYANALGQSGWADPSGFEEYVRGEALEEELETATSFRNKGWIQVGDATFDTLQLQQLEDAGERYVAISIYVCSDVSTVDVIDPTGASVVSADRPPRQPLEVEMTDADGALKIERRDAWSGATFC
jgi:hypothetical protein